MGLFTSASYALWKFVLLINTLNTGYVTKFIVKPRLNVTKWFNPLMHNVPKWSNFKDLAAFAARFLKCVWPFWDVMHQKVKNGNTLTMSERAQPSFSRSSVLRIAKNITSNEQNKSLMQVFLSKNTKYTTTTLIIFTS